MIERIVDSFVEKQFSSGIMQEKDMSVYRYGYTLMLESIINFLFSMIIAMFLGEIKAFLVFFMLFVPLRSFCGGYHAKKAWQCIGLSNVVVIATVMLSKWMTQVQFSQFLGVLGELVVAGVIIVLAPAENENKRLSAVEKIYYKKLAACIITIEAAISIGMLLANGKVWFCLIFLVHVVQLISLFSNLQISKK